VPLLFNKKKKKKKNFVSLGDVDDGASEA